MKTYLDCYPCFLRQALQAARLAGGTEAQQQAVVGGVLEVLVQMGADSTPPEIADQVHQLVRREVRNGDPYQTAKQAATQQALQLYPRLKARVAGADDPLEVALRLSIAGNIMDLGPELHYDLWDTVERVLAQPFAVDDSAALRQALATARSVLYLTDNAGETVFDRVLIETLAAPVTVAAKGGPILNDATCNDAVEAGLDQIAELISTGTDAPGVILSRCSDAFRARFEEADVVLAKGQANYETLSVAGPKVFCLLQVKCPVIAGDIGAPAGSIAVRRSR
ncbi:MAG: DUF89 family protein [Anaerolineales bacterium]|nr:DUF89 family protein [Anaerolineales bacterium]